jgi:uncharacterized protein YbjQ (UPF0145 family)
VSDVLGGRSLGTQDALRQAKKTCLAELRKEAREAGADAVIAVDLDYSEFSGHGKPMLFLVASGTAVQLARADIDAAYDRDTGLYMGRGTPAA